MESDLILTLKDESPDTHTFQAICSILDRLFLKQSPNYPNELSAALSLTTRIPAEQCRLPQWPLEAAGQILASKSGFWPVVRSLGRENSESFDWFPRIIASALPNQIPPQLVELALTVDNTQMASEFLRKTKIETIDLVPDYQSSSRELLESLPPTLKNLNWYGSLYDARFPNSMETLRTLGLQLRTFNGRTFDIEVFAKCLEDVPPSMTELGPNLLSGDAKKIELLCAENRFALQMESLSTEIGDRLAVFLSRAAFPRLNTLTLTIGQPPCADGDLFTGVGSGCLANASWWPQLQHLHLRSVYTSSVLIPLLNRLTTHLRSLSIAQDDPHWNPHTKKVGVNDEALSHLSVDVIAGLDSLTIDCAQLRGAVLREWVSNWPSDGRGPRSFHFKTIPWNEYKELGIFLESPVLQNVEELELSWPNYDTGRAFTIAASLSRSPYLKKLKVLNLRGWPINCKSIGQLTNEPSFADTLCELEISFDDKYDDLIELRTALAEFLRSPLANGLRILRVWNLSTSEPLCCAFEAHSGLLRNLRVLSIQANTVNIVSVAQLASANCLRHLWKLKLEGLDYVADSQTGTDSPLVREAVAKIGRAESLEQLFELELENVAGFSEQIVEALVDSPLVARLMVLPDIWQFKDIWKKSTVLCPLMRGVLESMSRKAADL